MDFLKYDLCGLREIMDVYKPQPDLKKASAIMRDAYMKMHEALVKTGRPIVYSICQYGSDSVWEWAAQAGGNLWRTTDDISDSFRSMALIGFSQAGLEKYAGPGHWNDPDMLEIGNGGMSADEYRTQMSLWAILAAPLLAGNDLSKMDETTRSILMNKEVIAVDQDTLGAQGFRLAPLQTWVRPLCGRGQGAGHFQLRDRRCAAAGDGAAQGPGIHWAGACTRSVGAPGPGGSRGVIYRNPAEGRSGDAAAVAVGLWLSRVQNRDPSTGSGQALGHSIY